MHNYHLDCGPLKYAFKVDIQKVYDTVDWSFLKEVLIGFGFHLKMIAWIMKCVLTTSFSLSINGVLHGFFKVEYELALAKITPSTSYYPCLFSCNVDDLRRNGKWPWPNEWAGLAWDAIRPREVEVEWAKMAASQNINNSTLGFENKLVHFEQPLIPLPLPVASQVTRDAYEGLFDVQNEVACLMIGRGWSVGELLSLEDEELLRLFGIPWLSSPVSESLPKEAERYTRSPARTTYSLKRLNSPAVPERTAVETILTMSPENKAHYELEKDAIHLLLTKIGDEIYSTVDVCKTAHEMWMAIERLQQESMESYYSRFYKMVNEMIRNNLTVATMQVKVQFLQQLQPERSRFVTIVKQQHDLDTVLYHKLFDILKLYQKEVNEICAERIAKNANPLALVAAAQQYPDPYYQAPKSHKSFAPPSKQASSTRSNASTKFKGKEIAKPITPLSESTSEEDNDPEQAQRDKDMQKNLALIEKYIKKIYKPINNNLRTASNSKNKNVDTTLRYKNDNQTGQFGNQRTMTVAGWRLKPQEGDADSTYHKRTDCCCANKPKEEKVPTADSGTDTEPLEQTTGLGSTQMKEKDVQKYQVKDRIQKEVEDHPRIFSISNKTKSVTASNDSLKSRTSNVNVVCATCVKCVFNSNHDACVSKYLNDVNARTKKPKVVPISTRNPKSQANKSIATPHKKTVASESTTQKSKSYYRMLYEKTSKTWKWWIEQQCPSGYKWVPKTKTKWVPKVRNENVQKRVSLAIYNASRITNHMKGNLKLLCNFVEKYMDTVHFGNDQFALIISYGDLVQGNITINMVYYVEGLNHNLFSVGQFCDADLEAAFQKSTCFVRDLQGNDLLTDNHGSDLYTISLQEKTSSTPICLMAKALPTQAWINYVPLVKRVKKKEVHSRQRLFQFLNKTLHAFFKEEGIEHQTSTPRTPEQNGVVKRENRTLVEAACTMILASKLPLFFWAEAIATACYTQNRSIIILTHEKTAYHIINDRKPLIKHLYIFCCTCYLTRDGENLDKMKEKGDLCILVVYSTQSKGHLVYNKRTRLIVESIQLRFDEIKEMTETSVANDTSGLVPQRQKALDYDNSGPVAQL
ncbi:retrovirus-related pol polyprotein from transposon TNT 1-94 [Tanacetum coccineum]